MDRKLKHIFIIIIKVKLILLKYKSKDVLMLVQAKTDIKDYICFHV